MGKRDKTGKSKKGKDVVEETLVAEEMRVTEETRVKATLDWINPAGPEAGQKYLVHQTPESSCATEKKKDTECTSFRSRAMGYDEVNDGTNGRVDKTLVTAHVVQVAEKSKDGDSEVVDVNPHSFSLRKSGDDLSLLEHVSRLGTRHFTGSSDPIVVDEWRSCLKRNFSSTCCPEDYRKDIAVHLPDGDAHNWWLTVDKRKGDQIRSFLDFEEEFNKKFFSPETWNRLECAYLDLVQGRELEDEQALVRRFIRGIRVEIRNHCLIQTFTSVSKLVERAAMIKIGLEGEKCMKSKKFSPSPSQPMKPVDKNRKFDNVENIKSEAKRNECAICGKNHSGTC